MGHMIYYETHLPLYEALVPLIWVHMSFYKNTPFDAKCASFWCKMCLCVRHNCLFVGHNCPSVRQFFSKKFNYTLFCREIWFTHFRGTFYQKICGARHSSNLWQPDCYDCYRLLRLMHILAHGTGGAPPRNWKQSWLLRIAVISSYITQLKQSEAIMNAIDCYDCYRLLRLVHILAHGTGGAGVIVIKEGGCANE